MFNIGGLVIYSGQGIYRLDRGSNQRFQAYLEFVRKGNMRIFQRKLA